jgi:hypothetical protein
MLDLRRDREADFLGTAVGLTRTERQVADHLQEIWGAGSDLRGGFIALSGISDPAAYRRTLDTLSGQVLGTIAASRFTSSYNFVNNLNAGCPKFEQGTVAMTESDCTWGRFYDSQTSQDTTAAALGYNMASETT